MLEGYHGRRRPALEALPVTGPWGTLHPVFEELLPSAFIVESGDPRAPSPELMPAELPFIAQAVEKRRNEFKKGRQCARAALARLGIPDFALLVGPSREPLWPSGVIGSLTHTDGVCAVAVASDVHFRGVGIDVEPAEAVSADVAAHVATLEETARLAHLEHELAARLVFSAKEAFYKCQFYITRQWLNFSDVTAELNPDGTFAVRLLVDAPPLSRGVRIYGRWLQRDGVFLTALALPRER